MTRLRQGYGVADEGRSPEVRRQDLQD